MQSSTAPSADPQQQALSQACQSLWLATLSLMTAYMHNGAPAHRYLLARRIARNFTTLCEQGNYGPATYAHFSQLAKRWQRIADKYSPAPAVQPGVFTRLQRLFAR